MVKSSFRFMFDFMHFLFVDATFDRHNELVGAPGLILIPLVGSAIIAAFLVVAIVFATSPVWIPCVVIASLVRYLESK